MLSEALTLVRMFIEESLHILPWFMLAVLLGVLVSLMSLDVIANRLFRKHGVLAIVCTAAIGAFSPFCSFTVIPLIRKLLRSGVPLSGVMAFWIASPSMSPEIFGLSASQLGVPLSTTRLAGAVVLSVGAGLIIMALERRGYLKNPLRAVHVVTTADAPTCGAKRAPAAAAACTGGAVAEATRERSLHVVRPEPVLAGVAAAGGRGGEIAVDDPSPRREPRSERPSTVRDEPPACVKKTSAAGDCASTATAGEDDGRAWWPQVVAEFRQLEMRPLLREVWEDSISLGKWLVIAVVLQVLIIRYVSQEVVSDVLGGAGILAFPLATILSIPLYLNGLSAIPIVDGLIEKGMLPGAAVTFLLAGSVTTIPAMVAVRSVVKNNVFLVYLGISVFGSLAIGMLSSLWL